MTAKLKAASLSDQQHIDEIQCDTKFGSFKSKKPVKKNNFFATKPQKEDKRDPQSLVGIWATRHKECPNFDGTHKKLVDSEASYSESFEESLEHADAKRLTQSFNRSMNASFYSNRQQPIATVSLDEQVDEDINRPKQAPNRTVAETLIEEDYDNDNFEAYQASIRLAARQFVHTGLHCQENKDKGALGSQFPRNQ